MSTPPIRVFKKLTITHNHGQCVLENGTIDEKGLARGICTGGGEQSRLLWATSNHAYPTGVEMTWPLYRRCVSQAYGRHDWNTPIEGEFTVDVCVF